MDDAEGIYHAYERLAAVADDLRDFAIVKGFPRPEILDLLAARDTGVVLAAWGDAVGGLVRSLSTRTGEPYLVTSARVLGLACGYAALRATSWNDLDFAEQYRRGPAVGIDNPGSLVDLAERLLALGGQVPATKPFLVWSVGDAIYRQRTQVDRQRPLSEILRTARYDLERHDLLKPVVAGA